MEPLLLNTGVAVVLASFFSNYALDPTKVLDPLITNPFYSRAFLQLGLFTLTIGLFLFAATRIIKNLIRGTKIFKT